MTNGQKLYEHKHPPRIAVIPVSRRAFATAADVMSVPNESHVPWRFLTAACQASWEKTAEGHYLFSGSAR